MLPAHIAVSADIVNRGDGLTVILTVSFAAHWLPPFTVITYCVLAVGDANGLETAGFDSAVVGSQLYVLPFTTVVLSCMVVPPQMDVSPMLLTVAWCTTVTFTESLLVQPFLPVTSIV